MLDGWSDGWMAGWSVCLPVPLVIPELLNILTLGLLCQKNCTMLRWEGVVSTPTISKGLLEHFSNPIHFIYIKLKSKGSFCIITFH